MEKYEWGLKKKSFLLFYAGGEIWCEHLDALYDKKELVLKKFKSDLDVIKKPSTTSHIIVILDETDVDSDILQVILDELSSIGKPIRKVAFVGLTVKNKRYIKSSANPLDFAVQCIDDLEKAKEWVL